MFAQNDDPPALPAEELWIIAQEEQSLAQLLGWCSRLLEVDVQYNPEQLEDRVRLRVTRMMSGREIWELTNLALADRGLSTVQTPGHEFLVVTTLDKAKDLARVEDPSLTEAWAGFVRTLIQLEHVESQDVLSTLSLLISKEHGSVSAATKDSILVGDIRPRVSQAVEVAQLLDQPARQAIVDEMELEHSSPTEVVALCERLALAQGEVSGEKLRGKVLAVPGKSQVLLVAPPEEMEALQSRVAQFDTSGPFLTRHYSPKRFGLSETSALVEQVLRATTSGQPEINWDMVQDKLTGTLILSAPSDLHTRVEDLFRRLEQTADSARRPLRSFPIKHRAAEELHQLLVGLVDAGALEQPGASEETAEPTTGIEGPTAPISSAVTVSNDEEPELTILVDAGSNRLVAMGEGRVLDQLELLIETLDVPHTEVLIEALVVSLTEGDTLDLAVELQRLVTDNDEQARLASLFGLGPLDPASVGLPAANGTGGSAAVLDPGSFSVLVSALETLNEGRTLTIPRVLVSNNQQANLDSVLQTPYTSTNASNTVATTSFGGTQDAGTSIQVTPTIAEGDRLILDYSVAISSFVGDSADPNIPPPRQENKLTSVVTIPDGFVVVVGGLEIETESEAFTQVPILGSIPILGALFRSQSTTTSRSRFFVFLRCNVLRDQQFADLRYLSREPMNEASISEDWPELEPRVIR